MERGMMTLRAPVLLLSLLCFMRLPNRGLEGPGNTKVRGFHTNILNSQ